jgi:hypothetical protein
VYSYATPIAWYVPAEGWQCQLDLRYSTTTSKHQSRIGAALSRVAAEEVAALGALAYAALVALCFRAS